MTQILVVREKDSFSAILTARGFSLVNLPLIKTEPLADLSELKSYLNNLDRFDGIFITSARAAKIFLAESKSAGKSYGGMFYVLGRRSLDLLNSAGCTVFTGGGEAKTAAGLLKLIPVEELTGKNFLVLRGNRSLRVVPETLKKIARVRETIVYQTIAAETSEEELIEIKEKFARGAVRAICFFSPSGAEEFIKRFADFSQGEITVAAIGATTANFLRINNLRVDFVAKKPTAEEFAEDLIEYLRKTH